MSENSSASVLLHATAQIVVAYSSRNELRSDRLRQLIGIVYNTLASITEVRGRKSQSEAPTGAPAATLGISRIDRPPGGWQETWRCS